MGDGEEGAREGFDEGDVGGFVVGEELGWGNALFAVGENEDGVGHFDGVLSLGLCDFEMRMVRRGYWMMDLC